MENNNNLNNEEINSLSNNNNLNNNEKINSLPNNNNLNTNNNNINNNNININNNETPTSPNFNNQNINNFTNPTPTNLVTNQPQVNPNPQAQILNNHQKYENNQEIDPDFTEPKKSHLGLIIFLILIIALLGGLAYYYFIYDNPKTIINKSINNYLNQTQIINLDSDKNYNVNYDLSFNIKTADKELNEILTIFNSIKLKGIIGLDANKKQNALDIIATYKDKELINISSIVPTKESYAYLKLNNLFDKALKVELDDSTTSENDYELGTSEDYKNILRTVKSAFTSTLEKAIYTKTYTKLNNKYVKKININITEEAIKEYYTKFLHDEKFIKSYAKITNTTEEEVTDELNKNMSEINPGIETISVYLDILKNDFLKLESSDETTNINLIKENNQYKLSVIENNTSKIDITFETTKNNNLYTINLGVNDYEDETNINLTLSYTYDPNPPELFDTTSYIEFDKLSENDTTSIMEKLLKNEALKAFLKDSGLEDYLNSVLPNI